VIIICNSCQ